MFLWNKWTSSPTSEAASHLRKNYINIRLAKAWTAIGWLSIIWKSDLSDKIKRNFIHTAVVSILLNGCTTSTLTKGMEKKTRIGSHKNVMSNI